MNGREEESQYYISQTRDQERFEERKVIFSWECLNSFATGCRTKTFVNLAPRHPLNMYLLIFYITIFFFFPLISHREM